MKFIPLVLLGLGLCLGLAACPQAGRGQEQDADRVAIRSEVELLIQQLGHSEFTQREAATERLLEIGLPAATALQRGQQSVDREIRYRCTRVLTRIRAEQRRRRLDAFITYRDSDSADGLPCWPRFRRIAGDTARSRALFAKMLQTEWELLARGDDPSQAAEALADRCSQLEQARSQFRQIPTLASVASLLLLASDDRINVPDQVGTKLYILCNQVPSFRQSLDTHGKSSSIVRRLVGQWIGRGEGAMTGYYCLNLAMRHNFPEGVGLARRILAQNNLPLHYREYAILAIAKLGDAKQVPALEGLLEDHSICRTRKDPKSRTTMQTQVCDIALATIIHLSGQDPRKFGFTQLRTNPLYVFVTNTAGFADDQQRIESRRKWDTFVRSHKTAGS